MYNNISVNNDMLKKTEKILKALGDKNRLRIINMLTVKEMCVCEITGILDLSQSTVSGHLKVLKEAEILEDKKDGLWVEYNLNRNDEFITELTDSILETFANDKNMKKDIQQAKKANREQLCRK